MIVGKAIFAKSYCRWLFPLNQQTICLKCPGVRMHSLCSSVIFQFGKVYGAVFFCVFFSEFFWQFFCLRSFFFIENFPAAHQMYVIIVYLCFFLCCDFWQPMYPSFLRPWINAVPGANHCRGHCGKDCWGASGPHCGKGLFDLVVDHLSAKV